MSDHSFSPNKLNDVFGFATIIAGVDAAKAIFAHPFVQIPPASAAFFAYFLTFRVKMYIDDSKHDFEKGGLPDIAIACLSWILFIFSAGAIEKQFEMAAAWFVLGLLVSLAWVVFSICKVNNPGARHAIYALSNIIHIVLLLIFICFDSWWLLLIGMALIAAETVLLSRINRAASEADQAVCAK